MRTRNEDVYDYATDQSAAERLLTEAARAVLAKGSNNAVGEGWQKRFAADLAAIEAAVLADAKARVEALPADRGDAEWSTVSRTAVLEALDPPR